MDTRRFHGIYPILYGFFDRHGAPLRDPIRAQVDAAIRHGAHGVAVLGLATETGKLNTSERRQIMERTAEAVNRRVPLAVTVAEPSVHGQAEFIHAAQDAGADWFILQPPAAAAGLGEAELLRFYGSVAERVDAPIALQNAAQYLGVQLSNASLKILTRNHANVCLLKGEAPAHVIQRLIEDTEGAYRVFNGRGGLELPDNLRGGCVGMIPAPECFEVQVRIYDLMRAGNEAEAERLYREILPLITFLMSSIDTFLCYGKRLTARRLGIAEVHDRAPCQHPTPFGLAMLERLAGGLGPL
jgi:4-hydroxy-tetrahydrodipicolinate synthase